MKKRLFALLLAVAMLAGLAACSAKPAEPSVDPAQSGTKTDDSSETTQTQTETQTETQTGEKDLYGFEDPVHIKIFYSRPSHFEYVGGETATNNTWIDLLKEHNIIPDLLYEVESSQAANKEATAIMSGTYPDILWAKSTDYLNWIKTGVIADITDAFEEYASDELKEYVYADGGMSMEAVMYNGRMYGLPYIGDAYNNAYVMWIRQDWLDNLGLEMPKTMDELKQVAYEFTYNDPDQNGKDDTYGLALSGASPTNYALGNFTSIFSAFGAYMGWDFTAYVQYEDGVVDWGGANVEGVKATLQFLQDMYKEGTIAKDFITMDNNAITEEAGAGRCGIWFSTYWGGLHPQREAVKIDPNARIVAARIPDGIDQGGTSMFFINTVDPIYCVSSKCEDPAVLVKLANLTVQKQIHPTDEEDYAKYMGDGVNYTGYDNSLIHMPQPFEGYMSYLAVMDALETGDTSELNASRMELYDALKAYYDAEAAGDPDFSDDKIVDGIGLNTMNGRDCSYAIFKQLTDEGKVVYNEYNVAPTESMAEYQSILNARFGEFIVKVILGEPVDSYDQFLESWYSSGGREMVDDAQAWFDANRK